MSYESACEFQEPAFDVKQEAGRPKQYLLGFQRRLIRPSHPEIEAICDRDEYSGSRIFQQSSNITTSATDYGRNLALY